MGEKEKEIMAYLAGALDGDGSFSIIKRTMFSEKEKRRIPRYRPCVQLSNLSSEIVGLLHKHLGGNTGKRKSRNPKWQPQVYWYCTGLVSAGTALCKIKDFLVVKRDRAELLIDFINKCLKIKDKKNISLETIVDREKDYLEIRRLNEERLVSPDPIRKKPLNSSRNPMDWAYIAGLIDTDGSIQISRRIVPSRKNYSYDSRVTIQMQSIKGIDFCFDKSACGYCTLIDASKLITKQKFHYRWTVDNREELKILLTNILPFLKYKKNQADVVLNFLEKDKFANRYNPQQYQEVHKMREDSYFLIRSLNDGIFKPSLIDLEARQGDKGEGESHAERLNEMDSKEYAKV